MKSMRILSTLDSDRELQERNEDADDFGMIRILSNFYYTQTVPALLYIEREIVSRSNSPSGNSTEKKYSSSPN